MEASEHWNVPTVYRGQLDSEAPRPPLSAYESRRHSPGILSSTVEISAGSPPDEEPEPVESEPIPPAVADIADPAPPELPVQAAKSDEPASPAAAAGGGAPPEEPPPTARPVGEPEPEPEEPTPVTGGPPDILRLAREAVQSRYPGEETLPEGDVRRAAYLMSCYVEAVQSDLRSPEDAKSYTNPRDRSPNDQGPRTGDLTATGNPSESDKALGDRHQHYTEARRNPSAAEQSQGSREVFPPAPSDDLRPHIETVSDGRSVTVRNLDVSGPILQSAEKAAAADPENGVLQWHSSNLHIDTDGFRYVASGPRAENPDSPALFFARIVDSRLGLNVYDGIQEMGLAHITTGVIKTPEAHAAAVEAGFPGGLRYVVPVVYHVDLETQTQTTIYLHPSGRQVEYGDDMDAIDTSGQTSQGSEINRVSWLSRKLEEIFAQHGLKASFDYLSFVVQKTDVGPGLTLIDARIRRPA